MKKRLVILIIIFIAITILMSVGAFEGIDSFFSNIDRSNIPNSVCKILNFVTTVGGTKVLPVIVILVSIVCIINKKTRYGILIFGNSLISTLSYLGIKNVIQRPRPSLPFFIHETGYSFPSGHTTNIVSFCGILIYIIWNRVKNKKLKIALVTFLVIWGRFGRFDKSFL